jgi:hypothetical protein
METVIATISNTPPEVGVPALSKAESIPVSLTRSRKFLLCMARMKRGLRRNTIITAVNAAMIDRKLK